MWLASPNWLIVTIGQAEQLRRYLSPQKSRFDERRLVDKRIAALLIAPAVRPQQTFKSTSLIPAQPNVVTERYCATDEDGAQQSIVDY